MITLRGDKGSHLLGRGCLESMTDTTGAARCVGAHSECEYKIDTPTERIINTEVGTTVDDDIHGRGDGASVGAVNTPRLEGPAVCVHEIIELAFYSALVRHGGL